MVESAVNNISFHYIDVSVSLRNRRILKLFLQQKFTESKRAIEHINYIFCNDEYLLNVNKRYLKHRFYTDIITFELSPKGSPMLADIFISVERVRDNAFKYKQPLIKELHRVIFHGALHLLGYKDKEEKDIKRMRRQEEKLLQEYFSSTWNTPTAED